MTIDIKRLIEKVINEKDTVEGTAQARDQAHHLGLTHTGYGYWNDAQGNTVARTIKGKLVRLEPGEEKRKTSAPASTKPQQYKDPYQEPKKKETDIEKIDPFNLRAQKHPQEEARMVSTNEMHAFFEALEYTQSQEKLSEKVASEEAYKQDKTWRKKLHQTGGYYELLRLQTTWQEYPHSTAPKEARESREQEWTKIIKDSGEYPKTKTVLPIERGMKINHEHLEQFLSAFTIGKTGALPYSGFSADPSLARGFAKTNSDASAGVVVRIHPNANGEVYGIHLSGVDPDEDEDELRTIGKFQSITAGFEDEREIVRYPMAKLRCKSIKKMMAPAKKNPGYDFKDVDEKQYLEVVYVIELEELGPGEQQNESSDDTHRHMVANNPVFEFYMNSCFRQEAPPHIQEAKSVMRKLVKETVAKLVTEVTPAEQAHHMGLTSAGGAYWQDASGKIVAKTTGDHLVKLDPEQSEKITNWRSNADTEKKNQHMDLSKPAIDPMKQYQGATNTYASYDWSKPKPFTPPKSSLPPSKPVTQEEANNPNNPIIWTNGSNTLKELNGIPFTPWTAPKEVADWATVEGQLDFDEPPFVNPPQGHKSGSWALKPSAGCVIIEPDGRVWIIEPTNHFGGYEHAFPKGGKEPELTMQQTAIKEVFEETGLKVNITGFHSDVEGQMTLTRLYAAVRVGGTPEAHGWESQAVKLVPVKDLPKYRRKVPFTQSPNASNILAKKIGGQEGTNNGGFYEGKDGVKRYVKFYKDPDRGESEVLANNFYRDLGIAAPNSNTFIVPKKEGNGSNIAFASDIIQGKELNQVKLTPELAKKILQGFIADIMTANYDAVGLEHDNIIVDEQGNPIRIDQGGSFLYRAMESSGKKKEEMLDAISEWDGLQSPNINPAYAKVWKASGLKPSDPEMLDVMVDQIKKVHALQKQYGGWERYIRAASPYLSKKDTHRVAKMMTARETLLIKKIAQLKGIEI